MLLRIGRSGSVVGPSSSSAWPPSGKLIALLNISSVSEEPLVSSRAAESLRSLERSEERLSSKLMLDEADEASLVSGLWVPSTPRSEMGWPYSKTGRLAGV